MMMNRYLTPMLVIAISMGVYFLYIDKAWKGIAQQLAHELVIEGFIAEANDARNILDKVIAEHRAFPPDADRRLSVLLPDTVDPARLILDINAIAGRHGLSVRSPLVILGRPDAESRDPFLEHVINFKVVSSYSAFWKFMLDVETSLAIRDIEQISFKSATLLEDEARGVVTNPEHQVFIYDVRIRTYSVN